MVDTHLGAHGTGHTHATRKTVSSPTMVHMIPNLHATVISNFETAPRPDTPHGQRHDPFLSRCEQASHSLGGMWAMTITPPLTLPRLACMMVSCLCCCPQKGSKSKWFPDMTRWRTEESLGCMTTWSQDRSSPGHLLSGSVRTAVSRLSWSVHNCAWFQAQDPSEARLDLAHISGVSRLTSYG